MPGTIKPSWDASHLAALWDAEGWDEDCPNCGKELGSTTAIRDDGPPRHIVVCDNCDYWRDFKLTFINQDQI